MDLKDVKKAKELLLENKLTQQEIGDHFGVSRGTISNIARNKQYADIEPRLQAVRIPGGQQKHLNLETQNLALVGQVENLRQERNLLKRQLRASTKRTSVVDSIVEQLAPIIKPLKPASPIKVSEKGDKVIEETLVLMLSDNHADQVVTPEEVDGLEEYNFPISARRHEVLVEELLAWKIKALSNFRFRKLVIFGLGDYTSGEIHGHVNRSYFGEQFTNDLAIAQLFSQMFRELAAHFEEIEIINIIGNHGRLTSNIEFTKEAVAANHDTLIMKIAQIHCKEISNIKFEFPTGLSTIKEVEGWNFFLHHGHGKKGSGKVWAQAEKKAGTIVPLHRGAVNYFCSGHFHSQGEAPANGGARMLGNGAFLACDPYSYQSLEAASDPCQYIFGVHRHNGVTWRLPLKLRTDGEKDGPRRYKIMEKL
jgi:transcriptional regulator with XRE-family HTH domain